ncbi:Permease of the major facilitator superfamily protein [Fulvimarina pelagi HTCC2506]|uniref:Permease of the major facilitator superfamily protein n=1 Tax=Fulvimarina pelagi HTCC2506 TaxID=314231 RepID=Q0G4A4_9HYPH|nr:MFS transporter [Fulvimarina pelagi]EAU41577.1 Permease of the major facilitator superfamily protein [Fulvimarina pelagi HTCC2506]
MSVVGNLGDLFFEDEENRVCKDIPDEACRDQPQNAGLHLLSLTATKSGDGLLDPKLILPWLLQSVGAPSAAIGLLVPMRESLALLPQILIAHRVREMKRRKWVWALGSAIEAAAIFAMVACLVAFEGAAAGWSVAALLAIFALGRSLASVSYKDVLGKTISKTKRGSITGLAGSVAAAVVLAYGGALALDILPLEQTVLLIGLGVGGALFAIAAFAFTMLVEEAGANEGAENGFKAILTYGQQAWADKQFRLFVITRALLTVTALAPPYLLLSAGENGERNLGTLGSFVLASSIAAILGSYVWGSLSDRSSRRVLMYSAIAGFVVLAASSAIAMIEAAQGWWPLAAPFALFLLMLSYQGVRQGRKIHLTDMAKAEDRAIYTAVSNTMIGIVLLVMGAFGFLADQLGLSFVLGAFAVFCLAAVFVAMRLDEVQED